jgi:hypothetical protein
VRGLEPRSAVLETAASPSMLHPHRQRWAPTLGASNPSPHSGERPSGYGEALFHGPLVAPEPMQYKPPMSRLLKRSLFSTCRN